MTEDNPVSSTRGVSLYPLHYQIIAQCARERRLHGNTFSPTIQFILEEWQEQRALLALLPEATRLALRRQLADQRDQPITSDAFPGP